MAPKTKSEGISLPLLWVGLEEAEISFVNQIIAQPQGEEFFLTFGQLAPPVLLGATPEENLERAQQLAYVTVRTVARLGLTIERMREFIEVMQRVVKVYDDMPAAEKKSLGSRKRARRKRT